MNDIDAATITAFLSHLEVDRASSNRTRNARIAPPRLASHRLASPRLASIRSFLRFAALRHPEHAALIHRVLAVPHHRVAKTLVEHLSEASRPRRRQPKRIAQAS